MIRREVKTGKTFENCSGARTLRMGKIFFSRENIEVKQRAENRVWTCVHRGMYTFSNRASMSQT